MKDLSGKILKSVGGFYHVETPDGLIVCKARGIFRLKNVSPCAGDNVAVHIEEQSEPLITDISERRNYIIRPPLANLDIALMVCSTCEPAPNALILDKLIAVFEYKGIEPVLVFTKTDKYICDDFAATYRNAGFSVIFTDNLTGSGADEIRAVLNGKTAALIGNSGVGKSSLMNTLLPDLQLGTAEISKKLGRGRHTTRQVELYPFGEGGYIADTPGFSTVDITRYDTIPSVEIQGCFREFTEYFGKCRFDDCRHLKEKGCAVTEALAAGKIAKSRYESYTVMYEEAKKAENTY